MAAAVQHGQYLARVQLAHEILRLPLPLVLRLGGGQAADGRGVRLALGGLYLAHYRGVVVVGCVIDDLAVAADVHLVWGWGWGFGWVGVGAGAGVRVLGWG